MLLCERKMQRRPREVPVDRPSAVQTYVYAALRRLTPVAYTPLFSLCTVCYTYICARIRPKALLRDDPREQSSSQRRRWLPAGGKPDASKHLSNTQAKRAATHKYVCDCIVRGYEKAYTVVMIVP